MGCVSCRILVGGVFSLPLGRAVLGDLLGSSGRWLKKMWESEGRRQSLSDPKDLAKRSAALLGPAACSSVLERRERRRESSCSLAAYSQPPRATFAPDKADRGSSSGSAANMADVTPGGRRVTHGRWLGPGQRPSAAAGLTTTAEQRTATAYLTPAPNSSSRPLSFQPGVDGPSCFQWILISAALALLPICCVSSPSSSRQATADAKVGRLKR